LALANALAVTVVAVLAVFVTTAGTLLAADWRADAASRQAWAEIDVAAAELCLPPQIDPLYLTSTTAEAVQSVFRAHRFTPLAPAPEASAHTPAANRATRIVAASGGCFQTAPASDAAARIARKTGTPDAPNVASTRPYPKASNAPLGQQPLVVDSFRARSRLFGAQPAASAVRLVANGGAWSEWLAHERCILAQVRPDGHGAHIVVLSGDRGERDQLDLPGPSTCDGTARGGEPPSCRGPPTAGGQRTRSRQTRLVEVSVEKPGTVGTVGALRPADPIVHDNLGRRVPVCAAELDVIETYLDHALRDVLATTNSDQGGQKS
jgi:hypothetical protein